MGLLIDKINNAIWKQSTIIPVIIIVCYICLLFLNISNTESRSLSLNLLVLEIFPLVVTGIMLYFVVRQILQILAYQKKQKAKDIWFKLSIWDIPRGLFIKTIASCMGLMWSIGWILYICALWSNFNSDGNYAEILGYAGMSSLDLFMLDINGNIIDNINGGINDPNLVRWPRVLKGGIVLISMLSALCTFFILISLFYSRFSAFLHSRTIKVTPTSNNHIYIFKGTGNKQQYLAKSIAKRDPRHLIIFIDSEDTKESEDIDGWTKVVNHLTLKNPIAAKMNQNSHGMFLISEGSIVDFNSNEIKTIAPKDFWLQLGLKRVHLLLEQLNRNVPIKISDDDKDIDNQVHFFFLSENRDHNISDASAISDIMKHEAIYGNVKVSIHCSARKDSVISIIEEKDVPKNQTIRLIDDARLSVDLLKRKISSHPIKYVDMDLIDNPGTVSSAFNALIIGFGETGRDVLKYLYEFSSFVDSSDCNKKSRVKLHVIDKSINILLGKFISDRPAIETKCAVNSDAKDSLIGFHSLDIQTKEYYNFIQSVISDINYIVVALGDDELNITIASQLAKYARQYRKTLKKFKIFVRVYNSDSFSHFDKIIKHYNNKLKAETDIDSILEPFGSLEDVYKYSLIVKDQFNEDGQKYGNAYWSYYEKVSAREKQKRKELGDDQQEMILSDWEIKDKKRINKFEDLQNALHSLTKLHMIESFMQNKQQDVPIETLWNNLLLSFDVRPNIIDNRRTFTPTTVIYKDVANDFNKLLTNLAITEHLRWNASHEMLGFVYGEEKNYRKQTHYCLLPWNELPEISDTNALRVYDYLVVETTLLLKRNKIFGEKS